MAKATASETKQQHQLEREQLEQLDKKIKSIGKDFAHFVQIAPSWKEIPSSYFLKIQDLYKKAGTIEAELDVLRAEDASNDALKKDIRKEIKKLMQELEKLRSVSQQVLKTQSLQYADAVPIPKEFPHGFHFFESVLLIVEVITMKMEKWKRNQK